MSDEAGLRLDREGPVARVTIDRPHARNAFARATWERLHAIALELAPAAASGDVRALVLRGSADAFAAGADLRDLDLALASGAAGGAAYEATVERALGALERLPCPTFAAVGGACTGGGAILASICDVRVGAANARVGVPVARTVGNVTTAANVARLAAVVGEARVRAWFVTAELDDAARALAAGFFYEVHADWDATVARADELALRAAAFAPRTIAAVRELALRTRHAATAGIDDADLLARCYGSADVREGIAAFLEKRPPRFLGR